MLILMSVNDSHHCKPERRQAMKDAFTVVKQVLWIILPSAKFPIYSSLYRYSYMNRTAEKHPSTFKHRFFFSEGGKKE